MLRNLLKDLSEVTDMQGQSETGLHGPVQTQGCGAVDPILMNASCRYVMFPQFHQTTPDLVSSSR